jgi:hypothetical protein
VIWQALILTYTYKYIIVILYMNQLDGEFEPQPLIGLPSEEIIADPTVVWHAIRGYDFAGLERMLLNGLEPSRNQLDYSVCVSVSPGQAKKVGREAASFYAYTLKDGLSLAIRSDAPVFPFGESSQFADEARFMKIGAEEIYGVMMPDWSLRKPLHEVSTIHEPRNPWQEERLIERTINHLKELGGGVAVGETVLVQNCMETSVAGMMLERGQEIQLEGAFMRSYAEVISTLRGIELPTVADALHLIYDRAGVHPTVYTFTPEQMAQIGSQNAQIVVNNGSYSIESSGFGFGKLKAPDFKSVFDDGYLKF